MKLLIGTDVPETEEELVYLQLMHSNQYNKHLMANFKSTVFHAHNSDSSNILLAKFVDWLDTQQLIDLEFSCRSGGLSITLLGDTNTTVSINRLHRNWYYKLAYMAVNSIAIEFNNGNL
jgi:hypothetical protein